MTDDIVIRLREHHGQGCTCEAWSYMDCGCQEAVWSEMYILEAAGEIERLRSIIESQNTKIKTLGRAIRNAGPQPKLHASIMRKHRKEWPTLWKAIDSLLESDTSYDNRK